MTRTEFEARLQRLVGRTLTAVRYFEIDYGTPNPTWSDEWGVDSLDFGLQFVLDDGSRCNLSWGGEFAQYGISLEVPVAEGARHIRSAEVSDSSRWHTLLGRRIGAVRVYWCLAEDVESTRREYPQDVELAFEHGRTVYVSAAQIGPCGLGWQRDHVTVVFDPVTARRLRLGPFAGDERKHGPRGRHDA